MMESKAIVGKYSLKAAKTGKHIRFATQVVFPNGRRVEFLESMTCKQAIKQAREVAYADLERDNG